jgi:hypothetical protein
VNRSWITGTGKRFYYSPQGLDRLWDPPFHPFVVGSFVPGVNRPVRGVNYSPPSISDVNNALRYTFTPHSSSKRGA